jgi:thiol-disulfide isomerase/thioredoxin
MPRPFHSLLLAVCLLGLQGRAAGTDWWEKLGVRDLAGASLTPSGRWMVLVFLSPECPVANAEIPVLNALANEFGSRGFSFVGVYADPTLTLTELRRHVSDYRLAFPAADDRAQRVVHATGAKYTPEVFVFAREGALLYRGRIDDRVDDFGAARPTATRQDLREALLALADGRSGPFPGQAGFGCSIAEPVQR